MDAPSGPSSRRRPRAGLRRRDFMTLLAAAPALRCAPAMGLKLPMAYEPEELDDGWLLSTPEAEGLDEDAVHAAYEQFFSDDAFTGARSLLIARHGRLVAEGYARSLDDRARMQAMGSATKSVTSLLVGLALTRGELAGLDTRVGDWLDEAELIDPAKADITVEQLLTMSSGLSWDPAAGDDEDGLRQAENSLVFLLNRALVDTPGSRPVYKDCDSLLLGAVLARAADLDLASQARERLFNHLKFGTWKWERHSDGFFYGAYGLWVRPRDMARLGVLAAGRGVWRGQALVPEPWLMDCVSAPVDLAEGSFGYQWWVHGHDVFAADGHGGQYIYAVPELELTLVYTADDEVRTHADGELLADFEAAMTPILQTAMK